MLDTARLSAVAAFALVLTLGATGCDRHDPPTEQAVEGAKDALDMREHEKLKDAGEDAADAVESAAEGLKEEAQAH